jgi:hypothetical protein
LLGFFAILAPACGPVSPHFLRKMTADRGVFDRFHTENGQKRWVSNIAETTMLTFLKR